MDDLNVSMDKERLIETVKTLTPYLYLFPNSKIDDKSLLMYAQALSHLEPAEINAAMLKLSHTSKFFPAVSEIIEQAQNIRNYAQKREIPTPEEAWGEALKLAKDCHVYKPWTYSHPAVEKAVKYFGKMELCTLEADAVNTARAQFMRIYAAVENREREREHNEAVLQSLPQAQREALTDVRTITNLLSEGMNMNRRAVSGE